MIDVDPFDEIEEFLANAYEAWRNPLIGFAPKGLPKPAGAGGDTIDGSQDRSFTFEEMRALYGNEWAEDFKAQFKAFTGIEFDA